jgi:phage-related holin
MDPLTKTIESILHWYWATYESINIVDTLLTIGISIPRIDS